MAGREQRKRIERSSMRKLAWSSRLSFASSYLQTEEFYGAEEAQDPPPSWLPSPGAWRLVTPHPSSTGLEGGARVEEGQGEEVVFVQLLQGTTLTDMWVSYRGAHT